MSDWYGKILVTVDRWYASSKTCSKCRYILDELRLDQRQWTCPRCGICHDRDINAARNLLAEGLRQLAGRDDRDLRVDASQQVRARLGRRSHTSSGSGALPA